MQGKIEGRRRRGKQRMRWLNGITDSVMCWEDTLEQGMAIHASILAWRIPWIEDPGGYSQT